MVIEDRPKIGETGPNHPPADCWSLPTSTG
jgi:hypothetical protein